MFSRHIRQLITSTVTSRPGISASAFLARSHVHCQGLRFDTRNPAYTPIARTLLLWGIYERAEIRFIRRYLHDSEAVVELGAGLGVTSAHILDTIGPRATFVVLEADPRVLEALKENISRHANGRDVRLVSAAALGNSGESPALGESSGKLIQDTEWNISERAPLGTARIADTTTLGTLVVEQDLERFDLVSDIEGAEVEFIWADPLSSPLKRCDRAILELHETVVDGRTVTVDELVERLEHDHGLIVRDRHESVVAATRASVGSN